MKKTEILSAQSPIPVAAAETLQLAEFLRGCPIGAVLPYDVLSREVKRNVQAEGRGMLSSARRIVEREDRLVFAAVRGVGIKRLSDEEIALIGSTSLRSINRTAGRGLRKSRCVDNIPALSSTAQLKWYTHVSLLSTFHQISRGISVRRIENVMSGMPVELGANAVLAVMLSSPKPQQRPRIEN